MADKILATITSKGQITLPAQHRKAWGLKPAIKLLLVRPTANWRRSNLGEEGAFLSGSMS